MQQPDGTFKIIFREKSREQQSGPIAAAKQEDYGWAKSTGEDLAYYEMIRVKGLFSVWHAFPGSWFP